MGGVVLVGHIEHDSNATVAAGSYPGQTASVGATAGAKGSMLSLVLVPR